MGLTSWLGIAAGLVGLLGLAGKWLWSRREREVGHLEAEIERRREEDEKGRRRRELESEVGKLDRDAIIERLRGG